MVVNSQDDNTMRRLILNIANLSEKYHQEYLAARWSKDKLLNDWYYAFEFFLDHTLLQGRSDRVSEKVVEAVFEVSEHNRNMIEEGFKSGNWKDLMVKLFERIGKGKVGKRADVNHVIDSLEFLREKISDRNVVKYTVDEVKARGVLQVYGELDGIKQVGDKVACFYLRDVVSLFELEGCVPPGDRRLLLPIDTWVKKFAKEYLVEGAKDPKNDEIKQKILKVCDDYGVSPAKLDQGIWYAGFNSYNVLIEILKQVDINVLIEILKQVDINVANSGMIRLIPYRDLS
ncbi:hypothetical protein B9Q06_08060 [Candidatus Marsarchaeota G2 archaeon ECH_B_2]|nr:MAG: hypothetical protein B9Q06_08060 [Candidatus Marsarchaeota G2 archaeon ECH_B_2]